MERSPEIEALVRRFTATGLADEALRNMLSASPAFLSIGTDPQEWWGGRDEVLAVSAAQSEEFQEHLEGDAGVRLLDVQAFEMERVGWAAARMALSTGTAGQAAILRSTFVLVREAGGWRFIQMHHSIGRPNLDLFGFDLTTGLDALVSSLDESTGALVAAAVPQGAVTVMFTDIEGSTSLAGAFGDDAWTEIVRAHFESLRQVVEGADGTVVKTLGDGGMYVFASARAALRAAVRIQHVVSEPGPAAGLRVRIGVHSGEVVEAEGDFLGMTVNTAARITAAADGGQIMASTITTGLAGATGFAFGQPLTVTLAGVAGTHRIVPVSWEATGHAP